MTSQQSTSTQRFLVSVSYCAANVVVLILLLYFAQVIIVKSVGLVLRESGEHPAFNYYQAVTAIYFGLFALLLACRIPLRRAAAVFLPSVLFVVFCFGPLAIYTLADDKSRDIGVTLTLLAMFGAALAVVAEVVWPQRTTVYSARRALLAIIGYGVAAGYLLSVAYGMSCVAISVDTWSLAGRSTSIVGTVAEWTSKGIVLVIGCVIGYSKGGISTPECAT